MDEEKLLPYSESPKIVVTCDRRNCDYNTGRRCSNLNLFLSLVQTELIDSSRGRPIFYKASVPACKRRKVRSLATKVNDK